MDFILRKPVIIDAQCLACEKLSIWATTDNFDKGEGTEICSTKLALAEMWGGLGWGERRREKKGPVRKLSQSIMGMRKTRRTQVC